MCAGSTIYKHYTKWEQTANYKCRNCFFRIFFGGDWGKGGKKLHSATLKNVEFLRAWIWTWQMKKCDLYILALSLQEISLGFRYNRDKVVRNIFQEIDVCLEPNELTVIKMGNRWVPRTERLIGRNERAPSHH